MIDIVVVGAGPAGCTAALNLAATRSTLLLERREADDTVRPAIGESLIPAAQRLLADMGLLEMFLQQGHLPCPGNRSVWGSSQLADWDSLRNPDGHGWHLDRNQFDALLRDAAKLRGARMVHGTRVVHTERMPGGWLILTTGEPVECRFLIDATGKSATLARRLGVRYTTEDALVCAWTSGQASRADGLLSFTFVEAIEDGWWYTAPVPNNRRILAFHGEKGNSVLRDGEALIRRAQATVELHRVLNDSGFRLDQPWQLTVAGGSIITPCAGKGWLAVGDAAVSFDPLSSQGLFHALYTGLAGALAAEDYLNGAEASMTDYAGAIASIHRAYRRHRDEWYAAETRWPDSPFWCGRVSREA